MKYFATLGPSFNKSKDIVEAIGLGLTGIRINLSHSNLKDCKNWLDEIKTADKISDKHTEILLDIRGAELRIKVKKDFPVGKDEVVFLSDRDMLDLENLVLIEEKALNIIEIGDLVHIDDGKVSLEITDIKGNLLKARAETEGIIKNSKSFSIKDKNVEMPPVSKDDLENLEYSKKYDIKSFMLPFVRSKEDVFFVRNTLDELNIKDYTIYSKIEDIIGFENIRDISSVSDEIVIARGDLGNNVGLLEVSRLQKKISKICKDMNKPFMVVTELLYSMIENPTPSRAEINDIYNSTLDGATSLMLTGETAIGKYPLKSIEYLINASKI